MSATAKPELRRLLHNQIKKNLIVAITLSVVGGVAFKILVGDRHKQAYLDFYKDYDVEKDFQMMKEKGVFDSCPPGS